MTQIALLLTSFLILLTNSGLLLVLALFISQLVTLVLAVLYIFYNFFCTRLPLSQRKTRGEQLTAERQVRHFSPDAVVRAGRKTGKENVNLQVVSLSFFLN